MNGYSARDEWLGLGLAFVDAVGVVNADFSVGGKWGALAALVEKGPQGLRKRLGPLLPKKIS